MLRLLCRNAGARTTGGEHTPAGGVPRAAVLTPPRPEERETGELTIGNPGRSPRRPSPCIEKNVGRGTMQATGGGVVERGARREAFQVSEASRGKFSLNSWKDRSLPTAIA